MVLARQLLARQIVRHDSVRNQTMTSLWRQCHRMTSYKGTFEYDISFAKWNHQFHHDYLLGNITFNLATSLIG